MKGTPLLVVDPEKCTGCRVCELACSVRQEGASDPSRSRVRVSAWGEEGPYLPLFCQHCEEPPCAEVCPVSATRREAGRVSSDADRCVGCGSCVSACPWCGPIFDRQRERVMRCDLCGGDPACVPLCPSGALSFLDEEELAAVKRKTAARMLLTERAPGR